MGGLPGHALRARFCPCRVCLRVVEGQHTHMAISGIKGSQIYRYMELLVNRVSWGWVEGGQTRTIMFLSAQMTCQKGRRLLADRDRSDMVP